MTENGAPLVGKSNEASPNQLRREEASLTGVARIDAWFSGSPWARLLKVVWIVGAGVAGVYAFVQTQCVAPRKQAEREGYADEPKVSVQYDFGTCRVLSKDPREIYQMRLGQFIFQINLSKPCQVDNYYGFRGGIRAAVLNPGEMVPEDPSIGPPLRESARLAGLQMCPVGDDCMLIVECRAAYRRKADLREFSTSGWGVFDPKGAQPQVLMPLLTLLTFDPDSEPRWTDERYRRAFECVAKQVAHRSQREAFIDSMERAAAEAAIPRK